MGVYTDLQPAYEAAGVAAFPVICTETDKRPAVANWQRMGLPASRQLAMRFDDLDALGFANGARNGITVLDLDDPDPEHVDRAQKRFGRARVIVQTPKGHHLLYRHQGEPRAVRGIPGEPWDVLGGGFTVGAGSITPRGRYELVEGSIADLDRLTPAIGLAGAITYTKPKPAANGGAIRAGKRNDTLFRALLRAVKACDDYDALLDEAMTMNDSYMPPMPDGEVADIAARVWTMEQDGRNWVGMKARAAMDREAILSFAHDPAAALLWNLLRVSHPNPGDRFAIDQIETAALMGWDRERLRSRINALIQSGRLARVHRGRGKGDPHVYTLVRALPDPAP